MAIKGRTKRTQSRSTRRVTPGRPVVIERHDPWYKAPAFTLTLAVVALLLTGYVAVDRLQYGWARDDVAGFTDRAEAPMQDLAAIAAGGLNGEPGMDSAAGLATGELAPEDLVANAQTWQQQLQGVTQALSGLALDERVAPEGGLPANEVGGRVPELDTVRAAYETGAGLYGQAAAAFMQAGQTTDQTRRGELATHAQTLVQAAQQTLDVGAGQLAILRARYDLELDLQLPGESSSGYSERSGGL